VTKNLDNTLGMLQTIFDKIDPETSKALVEPTIEQVFRLVEKKIERFMISGNSNVQENFATNEKIKIEQ
jgi:hypothetical protein